jgi:presenilin-like A22 family membrane protease
MMNVLQKVLLLFIATQILGLYTGVFIIEDAKTNLVVQQFFLSEQGITSLPLFIFYILLGAAIFLFLIKYHLEAILFLIEKAVIAATSSILFYAFLRPFISDVPLAMGISVFMGILLAVAKHFYVGLKNLAAVLASSGAGAVLGFSLNFFTSMLFFFIMAVYDYIAVFRTKHMVSMAKEIMSTNMSFTITAKEKLPSGKETRLDLGTGDLALPVMAEVAAYQIHPMLSFAVMGGAVAGVAFVLAYAWKFRKFLPAIPFIFSGILLAVAVSAGLLFLNLL